MHSARQVLWVKAFSLLVCAGGFYTVSAIAWQSGPFTGPLGQRSNTLPDISTQEPRLRSLHSKHAKQSPREYRPGSGEISCTVLGWALLPVPTLDLTCPTKDVSSPVRLYMRMSWSTDQGPPVGVDEVVARPDISTKMRMPVKHRAGRVAAAVKLPVRLHGNGRKREMWVIFDRATVEVNSD